MSPLLTNIIELMQALRILEQELCLTLDLSPAQLRLLLAMDRKELDLATLTQQLALDPSTLSRQLTKLATQKLIISSVPEDRRQRRYCLTDEGFEMHLKIIAWLDRSEEKLTSNWDPEEAQLLTVLLRRLLNGTDKLIV